MILISLYFFIFAFLDGNMAGVGGGDMRYTKTAKFLIIGRTLSFARSFFFRGWRTWVGGRG